MPLIAGMFSSIGPEPESKPQAPSSSARRYACAASVTRKAIAQIDGPCKRAKRCANESGSELMMKLMSPCRYSVTRLWRWRAIGTNPSFSNSAPSAAGSGAAYSMNSKPSVPIGLDVSWLPIAVAPLPWFYSSQCAAIGRADDCNRGPLSDDLGNNMPINNETVALNVDNRPGQDGSSHSRGAAERRAIDQPGGGRPSVTVAIAVPATNSPPGEAGRDPPVRGAGGPVPGRTRTARLRQRAAGETRGDAARRFQGTRAGLAGGGGLLCDDRRNGLSVAGPRRGSAAFLAFRDGAAADATGCDRREIELCAGPDQGHDRPAAAPAWRVIAPVHRVRLRPGARFVQSVAWRSRCRGNGP